MLGLLKGGIKAERRNIRDRLVKYIDQRGLNLTDAATLHTFENSETVKGQLEQLLTPRPGERTNLEKILSFWRPWRSNAQIVKGQASLGERLAELELQIADLKASLMNQNSSNKSTAS